MGEIVISGGGERSPTLNAIRILAEGLGEEPPKLLEFNYKPRVASYPVYRVSAALKEFGKFIRSN